MDYLRKNGLLVFNDEKLTLDTVVHPAHSAIALKRFLGDNSDILIKNSKTENAAAIKYLNENLDEKSILVDIGYAGTIQSYIEELTGLETTAEYLMTHLRAKSYPHLTMNGFLGNAIDHTSVHSPYKNRISFLEFICASDEASLLKYGSENAEQDVTFKDTTITTTRRRLVSRDIQNGIIQFAKDYKKFFINQSNTIDLDKTLITQWPLDFLRNPNKIDARVLNNIDHEDAFSNHNARFIVSDIEKELKKRDGKLTAEQARKLVDQSDWKEGARAILPAKANSGVKMFEKQNNIKLSIEPAIQRLILTP